MNKETKKLNPFFCAGCKSREEREANRKKKEEQEKKKK
jgi:hypothetical protein